MGSSSSVHRNQQPNMKHLTLSLESKAENLVISSSPFKEKPKNGNFVADDAAFKSQSSPSRSTTTFSVTDCGDDDGKDDSFFDSKAWLDSDCEDDFYSVKGEFTPSRGSTPVHHIFLNKAPSSEPGSVPEPSPTTQKKKLLDLFRESVRENPSEDGENTFDSEMKDVKATTVHELPKSAHSTPYVSWGNSACSSERTTNGDHVSLREKTVKSVQGCLPSLASCRSFSERKRKTSPAIAANGKA
ncbi:hypothetical protein LR48_Vigan03g181500 [Vigna angularis]|uniref:Uncharacterized protein n=2 Tax=Phaseolus angularis TaxID=3914 RepID=A0A0L9U6I2_PHAAN|nr:uncharacterized protein At3g27210 [Vigna angularis]KOM38433.1 hypothetical protein LR48_Vigan03g181500 [Vigna angularis]BAT84819.1 hypothetical protein VIGAN_04228000 [Vigna angularis var. angularis]